MNPAPLPQSVLDDVPFLPLALDAVEDECAHIEAQRKQLSNGANWLLPVAWMGLLFGSTRIGMPAVFPIIIVFTVMLRNMYGSPQRRFRSLLLKYVIPQLVEGMHPQWRFKEAMTHELLTATPADKRGLEVITGRVRIVNIQYELRGAHKGHKMRGHKVIAAYRDMQGVSQFFKGILVRVALPQSRNNKVLILPRDTPRIRVNSMHLFGLHQGAFYKLEPQDEAFARHYQAYATVGDESIFSVTLQGALAAFAERQEVALYALLSESYLYVAVDVGTSIKMLTYQEREELQRWVVALHGELRLLREAMAALTRGGLLG